VDPVITGTGLVSSLGGDVATAFAGYCHGRTAVHPLRAFVHNRYRTRHAYEIADRPDGTDVPGRASRWLGRAVGEALRQAGLASAALAGDRIAVIVGTGLGEQRSLELWWTEGGRLTLDQLQLGAGLGSPRPVTVVNACAAGLFALAIGADLLAEGRADTVVVGASDAITESMFGLLDRVNARPPTEVRPFDADRRGVILGEGAAAVVLERPAVAAARGAAPLARLRGIATSCDAHHETAPLPAGLARTFREAYRRASVRPDQIDLLLAHGTGTQLNDPAEARALREVFGAAVPRPLVTALKSLIGHTSGASGLMSLVVAVAALRTGRVPPTRNHRVPIPEAAGFRFARASPEHAPVRVCQVNAFGFGGVNAVAVVDRPQPVRRPRARPLGGDHRPAAGGATVVVTGVGVQSPGFRSVPEVLALARGRISVAQRGTPAEFDARAVLGRRGLRYKDRATRLALCAAYHALADAGLEAPAAAPDPAFGVVVASTFAIVESVCRVVSEIHAEGVTGTSPMDLPNVSGNVAAATVAIWFGLAGHNLTLSGSTTAGVDALALAATAIRAGRAQRMLVVGVEPAGAVAGRLVATVTPDSRPGGGLFDGAAAVLLEDRDAARARGADPVAVLAGYASEPTVARSVAGAQPDWLAGPGNRDALWLPPCRRHQPAADPPVAPAGWRGEALDLSAATGEAAAALGVLQAAVAASWLAGQPSRRALLTSGGCWSRGYASLSLRSAA
jgi:3-oxoacyl-[acyl-carrier-protein] synthase II